MKPTKRYLVTLSISDTDNAPWPLECAFYSSVNDRDEIEQDSRELVRLWHGDAPYRIVSVVEEK